MEYPSTMCSSDTSSDRKHPPPPPHHLNDVELKERSSKSLLANVLDIDDDFRHTCRPMTPGGTLPPNPAYFRTVFGYAQSQSTCPRCSSSNGGGGGVVGGGNGGLGMGGRGALSASECDLNMRANCFHDFHVDESSPGDDGNRIPDAIAPHACIKSSSDYELSLILKEIRYITDQVSARLVFLRALFLCIVLTP